MTWHSADGDASPTSFLLAGDRAFGDAEAGFHGEPDFPLPFKTDLPCPVLAQKIFRLTRRANQRDQLAGLTRQEGRLAIVTNVP
jgi:hypothetical protein